jgi:hypothetical protein
MTFQIEEGKFYRNRNGRKIGPMCRTPLTWNQSPEWKWCSDVSALGAERVSHTFRDDGFSDLRQSKAGLDLIAEWTDEPAPAPKPIMTKEALLDAAKAAVADRGLNYGSPEDNFGRIANLWNCHLENRGLRQDWALTSADVAYMMVLMKIARLENQPDHIDSIVDIAGYAACAATLSNSS